MFSLNFNLHIYLNDSISSVTDGEKAMKEHIQELHDYNDLKDAGQALLGRLAEIEGITTRDMYKRYNLETDD
jgi:hypothetical protein